MAVLELKGTQEYCCTVIKVDKVTPIKNSDFLGVILIDGYSIVVRKDEIKDGDTVLYISNECQISNKFLKKNNLYSNIEYNDNYKEVKDLPEEEQKKHKGFFNANGRVRTIKLKGVQSFGFIIKYQEVENTYGIKYNWDEHIGMCFDTIDGETFVKAYIPEIKEPKEKSNKLNKKLKSFDKLIPGKFSFHYDTQLLAKNLDIFHPNDSITISVKLHGTSFICGNILCNKKLPWYKRLINKIHKTYNTTEYQEIYSSRKIIKNRWDMKGKHDFYGTDVWGEYAKMLAGKLPKGITIYGEIIGYVSGTNKYIQKDYDYGCMPGTNKLMIYRVVSDDNNSKKEYTVEEVYNFTKTLMDIYPALKEHIHPIDILYKGLAGEFGGLDVSHHWQENFLKELQNDKGFFMEMNEPLCRNKVPREGIVIRKNDDKIPEAFKLKCVKFLTRESKLIDNGDVDIEMQNNN